MKKLIFLSLFCFCYCLHAIGQEKMLLKDFKTISTSETTQTYNLLKNEWPDNQNGADKPSALIRVKFENMTIEEAKKIAYKTSSNLLICKQKFRSQDPFNRYWIWVDSDVNGAYIEAVSPGGATSNRLEIPILSPKGIYEVTLMSEKSLTINIKTLPEEGATVFIDGENKGNANVDIPNIRIGNHNLIVSYNGQERINETINVSESNVTFGPYDFREKKAIKFTSDPSNAILYLNGEEVGKTPITKELPYGTYNVEAKISDAETDSRAFVVNAQSETTINLDPVKKKTFDVIAMYNGNKVRADLYINDKPEGNGQTSYTLTRPIGKSYKMRMSYYGDSKTKKIKVTKDMDPEQIFNISARNSFVWPWQRRYDASPMGVSLGYVSKQLVTKGYGIKYKENGVWDDGENKSLHGMQFGMHFQPCFSFGLGLYTGLFYEFYISGNDNYDYDTFMEHCLYVPAHAYFRLPFARKVALSIHGGLGFNYSVYGAYYGNYEEYGEEYSYEEFTDFYGEPYFPKRFNMAAEIGVGLRLGPVQINAQYSKGITNHKSYESIGAEYKTTQNKLSASVSYVFSSGEY